MSPIENFLQNLKKVRGRNGRWTACCPAHDDRSPSLAIREGEDGRVLVHCFGGCDIHSIVQAVGMDMGDLFPPEEKRKTYQQGTRQPVKPAFFASDLMRVISFEALVVMITAFDMSSGKKLSDADRARLMLAYERIDEAMRYANVQ